MQTSIGRSRLLLGATMAVLLVGAAVGVSAALNKDAGIELAAAPGAAATASQPADGTEEPEADETPAALPVEPDIGLECIDEGFEDYEPTAEELEAVNADSLALAALLESAGLDHDVIADEFGFRWVEYDYQDGIVQAVVNSYYRNQYPGEAFEGDSFPEDSFPEEPVPVEELELLSEENDALAAALDAAGVAYERMTDEAGFEWIEWDFEDAEAQAAIDAYYGELYGDCYSTGPIDDYEPSEQEIEASNAETDAMAVAFDAAGVSYTIETDELGFRWLDWDYDDQAAQVVAEEYWQAQGSVFAAEISADLDRLADAFDGADIAYVREGGEECETIIFDTDDAAALAVVAGI